MERCRLTDFSELYTRDFEIGDLFAIRQKWRAGTLFKMDHPRPSNGLLLLCGARGKYTSSSGESFVASVGSVVCLPEQSRYTVLNLADGLDFPDAYLIEFRLFSEGRPLSLGAMPFLVKDVNFCLLREMAEKAVLAYEAPLRSYCALRAEIYGLLSELGKGSSQAYQKRFSAIAKGIEFLRKNPYSDTSVEEIAKMCHVSSTNFRKLFKEYAGKSPTSYRLDLKIDAAKRMLTAENASFTYIAEALGFESEAYFSRLFKRKTGVSPRTYREKSMQRSE